jgi:hypothetical protein
MLGNGGFQEADKAARYTGGSVVAKESALRVLTRLAMRVPTLEHIDRLGCGALSTVSTCLHWPEGPLSSDFPVSF